MRIIVISDVVVTAAKLELGSTQTLAHKEGDRWILNDPAPDRALELAKCQMYLRKFNEWTKFSADYIDANRIMFSIPGDMRANPTVIGEFPIYIGFTEQNGFTRNCYRNESNLVLVATKENHGLSSAWLAARPGAFLSAEL